MLPNLYAVLSAPAIRVECPLLHAKLAPFRPNGTADLEDGLWGLAYYKEPQPTIIRHGPGHLPGSRGTAFSGDDRAKALLFHTQGTTSQTFAYPDQPILLGKWSIILQQAPSLDPRVADHIRKEILDDAPTTTAATSARNPLARWLLGRVARHRKEWSEPETHDTDIESATASVVASTRYLAALHRYLAGSKSSIPSFILCNGKSIIAVRWREPLCWIGCEPGHSCRICRRELFGEDPNPKRGTRHSRAIVLSSETGDTTGWMRLPQTTLLRIDEDLTTHVVYI